MKSMSADMYQQTTILQTSEVVGGSVTDAALWWDGPEWLQDRDAWPLNPVTTANEEIPAVILQALLDR